MDLQQEKVDLPCGPLDGKRHRAMERDQGRKNLAKQNTNGKMWSKNQKSIGELQEAIFFKNLKWEL